MGEALDDVSRLVAVCRCFVHAFRRQDGSADDRHQQQGAVETDGHWPVARPDETAITSAARMLGGTRHVDVPPHGSSRSIMRVLASHQTGISPQPTWMTLPLSTSTTRTGFP
jgi:hypothetical protein